MTVRQSAENLAERRRPWLFLLLLSPIAIFYVYWSWTEQLVGRGGDNALYMLMAQTFSPYSREEAILAGHFTQNSPFPPLYPALLALTGAAHSFLAAHQITTACLLISLFLLYKWIELLRLPLAVSIALPITFSLLPGTYEQTLPILSENLYLLLTIAFFTANACAKRSQRRLLALAVLAAAAALTRTVGTTLVCAYGLHLIIERPRRWPIYLAVASAPVIAWNLFLLSRGTHYVDQFARADRAGLADIALRASTQLSALEHGWTTNLTSGERLAPHCLALGLLCFAGALARCLRMHVDGIYIVAYLGVILIWPFPAEVSRFVYAILPVLLVQGCSLVNDLSKRQVAGGRLKSGALIVPLIALLIAIPDAGVAVRRLFMPLPEHLMEFRKEPGFLLGNAEDAVMNAQISYAFSRAVIGIGEVVPSNDCVYSVKPALVTLLSGRMSKATPREEFYQAELERDLTNGNCNYVLLLNMTFPSYGRPMYPYDRMPHRIRILRRYDVTTGDRPLTIAAIGLLSR